MMEELELTILNRIINELFVEADKLIKEGIKLSGQNKKIITIGLSLSVSGLMHAFLSPVVAVSLDWVNLFITGGIMSGNNLDNVKEETEKVKNFFEFFNIEKEDICQTLKLEFMSKLRIETFFNKNTIDLLIGNGILNLKNEEIEVFSKIRFNDNQENYLKEIMSKNEKINVINFLDLAIMESSSQNKRFVDFGGKNKTLKDIMVPTNRIKLMK